jgi:hypothetical protein
MVLTVARARWLQTHGAQTGSPRPSVRVRALCAATAIALLTNACGDARPPVEVAPSATQPSAVAAERAPETTTTPPAEQGAPGAQTPAHASAPAEAEASASAIDAEPPVPRARERGGPVPRGSLRGRVLYAGTPPEPELFALDAAAAAGCCEQGVDPSDRSLLVDAQGGVANALIEVPLGVVLPPQRDRVVELVQRCCRFEPPVLVVPAGALLRIRNEDALAGDAQADAKLNAPIALELPARGAVELRLDTPEVIELRSARRPWMHATLIVSSAGHVQLTGPDGRFAFDELPPGEYTVGVWHARLGSTRSTEEIRVPGQQGEFDVRIGPLPH